MKPAPSVLFHLLPGEALARAREIARRLEAEERFRAAVLASLWWLLPVLLAGFLLSGVILFGAGLWAADATGASGPWHLVLMGLVALCWLLANSLLLLLLFRRIGRSQA